MESVDQRTSNLPAFKVGGLKKKSAAFSKPCMNQSVQIPVELRSNHSQSMMGLVTLKSFDLKSLHLQQ